MPRRALPVAAAVVLLALVLLIARGCGSDALSAEELRSQASAICVRTWEATDRIAMPNGPEGGARFLREGIARLRPALTQLQRLEPPDELHATYRRVLRLSARELGLIWQQERAIEHGADVIETFRTLQSQLDPIVGQENNAWQMLGIDACTRR